MTISQAFDLARTELQNGRFSQAREICNQILAVNALHADAIHLLGLLALQEGRPEAAGGLLRSAIDLFTKPDDLASAWSNLGVVQMGLKQFDASITSFNTALSLRPNAAEPHNNLGEVLLRMGNDLQAEPHLRQALTIRPDYPEALNNLANLLHVQGQFRAAIKYLEHALALNPNYAQAHWNLALLLLLIGENERGWREFEWRIKMTEHRHRFSRFKQPRWDGSSAKGMRLLLHCEQGLGDAIHFARYVSKVAERGAAISLLCPASLSAIFAKLPGVDRVIAVGDSLGEFDSHCPFPSLPFVLNMPDPFWDQPYLTADTDKIAKVKASPPFKDPQRLRVGLVWQGQPDPPGRSIPLGQLRPLAMAGIQLISLQLGEGRDQLQQVDFEITDAAHLINDFADTAAIMQTLDLIISIDTSAAQLAGAIGLPVWVLLKKVPDWRWQLDRTDSPWYPSMRLFRQKEFSNWDNPIADVARELHSLAPRD